MSGEDFKKPPGEDVPVRPVPGLDIRVSNAMAKSELAGGVYLDKVPVGGRLEVRTRNTVYLIEKCADGLYIRGNMKYCPEPTRVHIPGSTFGGSMIKVNFIGRGMYMEYVLPDGRVVTTSQINEVREL